MLTVCTKEKCHSSKRAKQWLEEHRISYQEKKLSVHRLTMREFLQILLLTENGTDDILSHRATLYKQLGRQLEELTLSELRILVGENPSLLRSPIIFDDKTLLIGFNSNEMRILISRKERQAQQRRDLLTCRYIQAEGFTE